MQHSHKEHQNLFTYIAIIQHSGNNKIHWTKTVRQTQPLLHKGKPFYLDCKTKSKVINYDEELIVLFFSTLDYLARSYHFQGKKNLNYDRATASKYGIFGFMNVVDYFEGGGKTHALSVVVSIS